MATVTVGRKACAVNPLKMSAPLGASYAFLGLDRCLPLMHGAQGCTSLGLVLLVRHFKETIPLQTSAMNEVTTILGGLENLEQALVNIHQRAQPALVGVCTTGLTETKGDDVAGHLTLIRQAHPELADMAVVTVATPDYVGGFELGFAKALEAIVTQLVPAAEGTSRTPGQVNVLAGCHLTPGDVDELRCLIESFGLAPIMLPDLAGALDGHIPDTFLPTTLGGTRLDAIRAMGRSVVTLAIGQHTFAAAQALRARTGVPVRQFDRVSGLRAVDDLVRALMEISGRQPAARVKRERSRLQDAMLDAHFHLGGRKVALAAEPDLLATLAHLVADLGVQVAVAVAPSESPVLERLPCADVQVGDLDDFERLARERGAELLVTHAHGRQASARTGIPLLRAGLPIFDRIGSQHVVTAGYRGSRERLTEIANLFMAQIHAHGPADWPLHADTATALGLATAQRAAPAAPTEHTVRVQDIGRAPRRNEEHAITEESP